MVWQNHAGFNSATLHTWHMDDVYLLGPATGVGLWCVFELQVNDH